MAHTWFNDVQRLTIDLVRAPSVTNTAAEAAFADHLRDLLAAQPYFQTNPAQLWAAPIPGDPFERRNVWALVRGTGTATVVLSGHYDVVDIANYGSLAPWACDPPALLPRLIDELAAHPASVADQLALDDLRSGEYLPGRGALDMKSGIAAGIAVLQRFADTPGRSGNMLLLATPDEEISSEGMRAAALDLPQIAATHGLDLAAAINLDAMADRGDGQDGQAVFLGSVGKLLPSVYIVGREAHAGYPFDGINPNRIAAEITRRLDCNLALCDHADGEWSPPPVNLRQSDTKTGYDVTTPLAAWCTYNLLCYERGPAAVLGLVRREVEAALHDVVTQHRAAAQRYAAQTGRDTLAIDVPRVWSFDELRAYALNRSGPQIGARIEALVAELAQNTSLDLPDLSRHITAHLWQLSGLSGPAAVVGFASLYYPRVRVDRATPTHLRLRAVVEQQVAAVAAASHTSIRIRPLFPAISDMSFLGGSDSAADLATMANNTPPWGTRLRFGYQAAQTLNLPTINIGPWGRDYHQRTERVYMPYAFEIVPELIWRVTTDLLHES